MSEEQIRIDRVIVKDLVKFAEIVIASPQYVQMIPITMQRAISHLHNPYANEDDVALLVAYIGEECVGYFGILPIMLKHGILQSKVYWFSTWLVSPQFRGRSIGSLLMEAALSLNQDYMIVGSGPARKICHRFGFHEFMPLVYYSVDMTGMQRLNPIVWMFRMFRKLLSPLGIKARISNRLTKGFERLASPLTKRFFYWLISLLEDGRMGGFCYEEVDEVRDYDFDANMPSTAFYRGSEAVNWMLRYPWVVESGKSQTEDNGFYFTDTRDIFKNIVVEVYSTDDGNFIGYVVLSYSIIAGKRVLKILDNHFVNEEHTTCVIHLAMRYSQNLNIDKIELPGYMRKYNHSRIIQDLLWHEKHRIYQCSPKSDASPLGKWWQDIVLDNCDGDMPFT